MVILYDKGLYMAKINQLEALHSQLATHLTNMENLRAKMSQFWEDERAYEVGSILTEEIRTVKVTMTQTATEIAVLKNTVDKLDGTNNAQRQVLEDAFRTLEVAAEFIPE